MNTDDTVANMANVFNEPGGCHDYAHPARGRSAAAKARRQSHGFMLLPYRQGDLDGLCGVYAVINAIRLASGDRARELADEDWQSLFGELAVSVEDARSLAYAAVHGIDTKLLKTILQCAARHMLDEHDMAFTFKQVLSGIERPPLHDVLNRLAEATRQPNASVLLALRGHLDHWTVVRSVTKAGLMLFDSSRFHRVSVPSCRMSYERADGFKRSHVIHPTALFAVTL